MEEGVSKKLRTESQDIDVAYIKIKDWFFSFKYFRDMAVTKAPVEQDKTTHIIKFYEESTSNK